MIRKLFSVFLGLALLVGCDQEQIDLSADEMDGVKFELTSLATETDEESGDTYSQITFDITNHSQIEIMQIDYVMTLKDAEGNAMQTIDSFYNGADVPIQPEEIRIGSYRFDQELEDKPASIDVSMKKIYSREEMPPMHLPQAGESLYQALNSAYLQNMEAESPTSVTLNVDDKGQVTGYTVTDPGMIREAVNAFMRIKVGPECETDVTTQHPESILFTFADGTQEVIYLHKDNVEVNVYGQMRYYELNDLDEFLNYMQMQGSVATN